MIPARARPPSHHQLRLLAQRSDYRRPAQNHRDHHHPGSDAFRTSLHCGPHSSNKRKKRSAPRMNPNNRIGCTKRPLVSNLPALGSQSIWHAPVSHRCPQPCSLSDSHSHPPHTPPPAILGSRSVAARPSKSTPSSAGTAECAQDAPPLFGRGTPRSSRSEADDRSTQSSSVLSGHSRAKWPFLPQMWQVPVLSPPPVELPKNPRLTVS